MFDLNSFDLDIDDDISCSIFSKAVDQKPKNNVGGTKVCGSNTPNSKINESRRELLEQPTDSLSRGPNSFSHPPQVLESKEKCLKRPFLGNEKPIKKRLSNEGLVQRKFPGPAGLLPDKPFKEICHVSLSSEKTDNGTDMRGDNEPMVFSQSSGSMFLETNYQKLLSDFNLEEPKNPLSKYTVEWLKKTALTKGFQGRKIPFLGLVVHSVDHTMPDPLVVLRDPTGEIQGSLHREVWADLGEKLKPGVAVALRQVGVLITGVIRRQIYLNITMNNILALYTPSDNDTQVEVTTVNRTSNSELMKNFDQWLPQPLRNAPAKPPSNGPLFTTVNDINFSTKTKEKVFSTEESKKGKPKESERQALDSLAIVLSDFADDMNVMQESGGAGGRPTNPRQGLSQAESLIFDEVLSGIDLNEFEM